MNLAARKEEAAFADLVYDMPGMGCISRGHICIRSLIIEWRMDLKAASLETGRPVG